MTKEEAIRKLTQLKNKYLDEYVDYDNTASAYDLAIEALEKQIPKKPELVPVKENTKHTWKCPTCGGYEIFNFCQHCGQKLSWERAPRGKEKE